MFCVNILARLGDTVLMEHIDPRLARALELVDWLSDEDASLHHVAACLAVSVPIELIPMSDALRLEIEGILGVQSPGRV